MSISFRLSHNEWCDSGCGFLYACGPVALVRWFGQKVGSRPALFCIHRVNRCTLAMIRSHDDSTINIYWYYYYYWIINLPLACEASALAPLRRKRERMYPHFSDSTSVVLPTPLLPSSMTRTREKGFPDTPSWRRYMSPRSRTIVCIHT